MQTLSIATLLLYHHVLTRKKCDGYGNAQLNPELCCKFKTNLSSTAMRTRDEVRVCICLHTAVFEELNFYALNYFN